MKQHLKLSVTELLAIETLRVAKTTTIPNIANFLISLTGYLNESLKISLIFI